MGLLINGQWHDHWYDTSKSEGRFERDAARFRNHIAAGTRFEPAAGRYRLYVSLACPWAHRTLIFRTLKQLEDIIPVSVVKPLMLENGWEFDDEPLYGLRFLH
jgi:glutathionyl-hydroquinone reductase